MKKQLTIWLVIFSLLPQIALANIDDSEEFKQYLNQRDKELTAYKKTVDKELLQFVSAWEDAENEYRGQIEKKWEKSLLPGKKQWVEYSTDLNQRTTVDFDAGSVTVEVRDTLTADQATALAKKTISTLTNTSLSETLLKDPVVQSVRKKLTENNKKLLLPKSSPFILSKKHVGKLTNISTNFDKNKTTITIPLKASLLSDNVQIYYPFAKKQADKYKIPTSLILAIIHTESSFNPLARSHIPAFGLMQIVPVSAGKDVTKFLNGKVTLLDSNYLYRAEQNIEAGTVYLHLLMSRYFKGVKDNKKKLYMAIAGYNTGPGNVARAVSNTTSLKKAVESANKQTSQQLYFTLIENLPHQETVGYLKKVLKRTSHYNNLLIKEGK